MKKLLKRIISEPLVQFLIIGTLLYLINMYVQKLSDKESLEIVVDNEKIGQILMNYKTQTGALPNKQQLDAIIENYIKEEISFREAMKMGLDKEDEIIRRRLIQKYDFLQTDLAEVKTPNEDELKQYYQSNPASFQKDASVSFAHIFFSTDNSSDTAAKQRALEVLNQMNSGSVQLASETGDRFPLQYDYTDQSELDLQQNFGNKPIANALFKAPLNTWTGPVQSGYGWHLIYVTKIDSTSLIPFESVKEDVKVKYAESEKAKQNRKLFDQISEKFIINRAYLEANK